MHPSNLIIAIDGYSSTGKSSISKEIAQQLQYVHIDTGAMYRAITLFAMQHCMKDGQSFDWECVLKSLPTITLEFRLNPSNENEMYLNNQNVEQEIRSIEVSERVSEIAKNAEIRTYLVEKQRVLGEKGRIVMDGRDIGSVVFPHADYKFFLTASVEERASRRYLQLKNAGKEIPLEQIIDNLKSRDYTDENREVAPLKILEDSIIIDNTHLDKKACIALIMRKINEGNPNY